MPTSFEIRADRAERSTAAPENRRRALPMFLMVVGGLIAASLLLIVLLVGALLAFRAGPSIESEDVPTVVEAQPSAVLPGNGVPEIDYANPVASVVLENSSVVGAVPDGDILLLQRALPGTAGSGCEGLDSRHELVATSSTGANVSVVWPDYVGNARVHFSPNGVGALVLGCDGTSVLRSLVLFGADGEVAIRELNLTNDLVSLVGNPVWAGDSSSFVATYATENGLEHVRVSQLGEILDREAADGVFLAELSDGSKFETANGWLTRDGLPPLVLQDTGAVVSAVTDHSALRTVIHGGHGAVVFTSGVDGYSPVFLDRPIVSADWSVNDALILLASSPAELYVVDLTLPIARLVKVESSTGLEGSTSVAFADQGSVLAVGADTSATTVIRFASPNEESDR